MKKWLIRAGIGLAVVFLVAMIAGIIAVRRFEPFILDGVKNYLSKRFDSEVEFQSLKVSFPMQSPWRVLKEGGKGGKARVRGSGLLLRHEGRRDLPPMFRMDEFVCDIDLHSVFNRPVLVEQVVIRGMEIHVPPKGQRPSLRGEKQPEPPPAKQLGPPSVIIQLVKLDGSKLVIEPKDPKKDPLVFDLQKLTLHPSKTGKVAMDYEATLTNAKPPGLIVSKGEFGPWHGEEPGESPLAGTYVFANADLGVFKGISGTLHSAGKFSGRLNYILVDGEARVPNFSLDMANHPINLVTKYHALVDGTNGNTVLDPVQARLGQSQFTCKGEVAKREGDTGKRILLDVDMRDARLEDVLFLAMKNERPFMKGPLKLVTQLEIPPGPGTIGQRLMLHKGTFQIIDAQFTGSTIQHKLDEFSRRGQGLSGEESPQEVPVRMKGAFDIAKGAIHFSTLTFEIPGALVNLAGTYAFMRDNIDFLGEVKLDAKVSQAVGGWKGALLKPVDPFFSKRGAGTYLPVKIQGSRSKPEFGMTKTSEVDARLQRTR